MKCIPIDEWSEMLRDLSRSTSEKDTVSILRYHIGKWTDDSNQSSREKPHISAVVTDERQTAVKP